MINIETSDFLRAEGSDQAIAETDAKYRGYCRAIDRRILRNEEDSEECVSDTWIRAWDVMPPQRPEKLAPFLGRITRNLSLDRWKHLHTEKRGRGETALALEALGGCVPAVDPTAQIADQMTLASALNKFLAGLPA